MKRIAYRVSCWLLYIFLRIFFHYRTYGKENIPKQGGVVLAGNHCSFLDPPLMGCTISRHISFVARETLAGSKIFSFLLWLYETVLIRRESSDIKAMRQILARLMAGRIVGLFPEGTRSLDGNLGNFTTGAVTVAQMAKVPLIPVAIYGSFKALPKGAKWFKRCKLSVVYGTALDVSTGTREEVTEILRRTVSLLLEKAHKNMADYTKV